MFSEEAHQLIQDHAMYDRGPAADILTPRDLKKLPKPAEELGYCCKISVRYKGQTLGNFSCMSREQYAEALGNEVALKWIDSYVEREAMYLLLKQLCGGGS